MNLIKNLKITTFADNLTMTKCLGQWGLSFLLEFIDAKDNNRKIVFDTGVHKKSLLYNVKQLKADLSDLDCLVISHGHGDHTSATVEIVKATDGLQVYAHPHTFKPRFVEDKSGKRRRHGRIELDGVSQPFCSELSKEPGSGGRQARGELGSIRYCACVWPGKWELLARCNRA